MKVSFKGDKIVISTRSKLDYSYKEKVNVSYFRSRQVRKVKIFTKPNKYTYEFPIGYSFFLLNMLSKEMSPEDIEMVKSHFKSDLLENFDFQHLYPNQIEDLSKLLRWKRGIFQCYTGYGKSEIITVMVNNFIRMGKKVLIIAPSNSTSQEIRDRLKSNGVEVSKSYKGGAQVNVINPKAFVKTTNWTKLVAKNCPSLHEMDIVIADEVEMTINDSFHKVKKYLDHVEYFYGFSASANKSKSKPIRRDAKLLKMLNSQLNAIVSIYGFTAVYQLPTQNKVTIHTLNTNLSGYKFVGESDSKSEYHALVEDLMKYTGFIKSVKYILSKVPILFLPINNLDVIDNLINNEVTEGTILVIRGSGYHLYLKGENIKKISLEESKKMIADGKIHFVMGTSTSFRALDFRKMNHILCTFGKLTSVCIQYVGRVARDIEMNIWYIDSTPKIKIYSKTIQNNQKMVEDFYKNCEIDYKEYFLKS